MRTPASIARHPIHPMLVPLPIGLWVFSLACDLIFAFGSASPAWKTVALYTMVGGLVGALAAALPGSIDLLSLPRASRRTAIIHMSINLAAVVLFALNAWLRVSAADAGAGSSATVWLSLVGIALLAVSGWLGGKLVYERGVAVDTAGLGVAGRSDVVDLSRFRNHQARNGKPREQGRDPKQRPRSKPPPLSSWKP